MKCQGKIRIKMVGAKMVVSIINSCVFFYCIFGKIAYIKKKITSSIFVYYVYYSY